MLPTWNSFKEEIFTIFLNFYYEFSAHEEKLKFLIYIFNLLILKNYRLTRNKKRKYREFPLMSFA
jgi:hypothetical protein